MLRGRSAGIVCSVEHSCHPCADHRYSCGAVQHPHNWAACCPWWLPAAALHCSRSWDWLSTAEAWAGPDDVPSKGRGLVLRYPTVVAGVTGARSWMSDSGMEARCVGICTWLRVWRASRCWCSAGGFKDSMIPPGAVSPSWHSSNHTCQRVPSTTTQRHCINVTVYLQLYMWC